MILNAMDKYQENKNVQENGCGALMNLACDDDNQKRIANEGGTKVILNAMKNHDSSRMQKYGCGALQYLASLAMMITRKQSQKWWYQGGSQRDEKTQIERWCAGIWLWSP